MHIVCIMWVPFFFFFNEQNTVSLYIYCQKLKREEKARWRFQEARSLRYLGGHKTPRRGAKNIGRQTGQL